MHLPSSTDVHLFTIFCNFFVVVVFLVFLSYFTTADMFHSFLVHRATKQTTKTAFPAGSCRIFRFVREYFGCSQLSYLPRALWRLRWRGKEVSAWCSPSNTCIREISYERNTRWHWRFSQSAFVLWRYHSIRFKFPSASKSRSLVELWEAWPQTTRLVCNWWENRSKQMNLMSFSFFHKSSEGFRIESIDRRKNRVFSAFVVHFQKIFRRLLFIFYF